LSQARRIKMGISRICFVMGVAFVLWSVGWLVATTIGSIGSIDDTRLLSSGLITQYAMAIGKRGQRYVLLGLRVFC
jgi:hypothetical protein